jgi:hypothetical protein
MVMGIVMAGAGWLMTRHLEEDVKTRSSTPGT